MTGDQCWRGVRLQTVETGVDPDDERFRVAVPVGWGEPAASGLVGLACTGRQAHRDPLRLPSAASAWIAPLDRRAQAVGRADDLGGALHAMLLRRQGCPDRALWTGEDGPLGFVLHLGAFADPGTGFDAPSFTPAVEAAALALSLEWAARPEPDDALPPALRLAGLDLMLAGLGHDYAAPAARRAAASIVAQARAIVTRIDPRLRLIAAEAGPAERLLGVETAGFAPPFDLVDEAGGLTQASRLRLAALSVSPEQALALTLAGRPPLALPPPASHLAMHDALAPLLDAAPSRPRPALRLAANAPPRPRRVALPPRARGFTQKVSIGSQRLYVRTAQYEDGRLGELSLAMPGRGDGTARGLLEALSDAVSIGLQHGIGLETYVERFAGLRFGCHGAVEGDPSILAASSPLDYAFRSLSEAYLGRHLADPPPGQTAPLPDHDMPMLPFDPPDDAPPPVRQRSLRLVRAS